jgi:hypothetical protein
MSKVPHRPQTPERRAAAEAARLTRAAAAASAQAQVERVIAKLPSSWELPEESPKGEREMGKDAFRRGKRPLP